MTWSALWWHICNLTWAGAKGLGPWGTGAVASSHYQLWGWQACRFPGVSFFSWKPV